MRRLGQGVELTLVHARRHHEVAGAFRRGADEHRGFDLEEAFAVEEASHLHCHAVAQFEIASHGIASQVKVAVSHADIIAAVAFVLDGERRNFARVKYIQFRSEDFDVAGRHIRVFRCAFGYTAFSLNDKFAAEMIGCFVERGIDLVVENDLSDAVAVA